MGSPLKSIGIDRGDKVTRLEAFVDASFAFALTLLVISVDSVPGSAEELKAALKQIPTFILSFNLIAQIWTSHAQWSRWFGIDDEVSDRISLVLVLVLLIFVYPLKMVFSGFFHAISGGWLPATFTLQRDTDLLLVFQVFALGYGLMVMMLALLFGRALKLADSLDLSPTERFLARHHRTDWWVVAGFCALSFLMATFLPESLRDTEWLGLPGYILFLLFIFQFFRWQVRKRKLAQLQAG